MAIDYKKEWEKLQESTGHCTVLKNDTGTTLGVIMTGQIQTTISNREKLMEQFIRARITTNISESKGGSHEVEIYINGLPRGRYLVSKLEFATWCKNRKEVK